MLGLGRAHLGVALLAGLTVVAAGVLLSLPAIPQDPGYHRFADTRLFLGIPHFGDVASNLPVVLVGALGLWALRSGRDGLAVDAAGRWCYRVFFAGIALTGWGSAHYHWAPDSQSLVWDRLPMTVAFMALLAGVLGDRLGPRLGLGALGPLVAMGLASVLYWHLTERAGAGDLRPYAFVQFYPLVAVPVLLGFFPARYSGGSALLWVGALYVLAKGFEYLDRPVLAGSRLVGGHALKHLVSAGAAYVVLRMLESRRPLAGR